MRLTEMFPTLKGIEFKAVGRIYGYFYEYIVRFRGKLGMALLSGFGLMAMDILRPWPIKIIFDGILFQKHKVMKYPLVPDLLEKGPVWLLTAACVSIVLIAFFRGLFSYSEEVQTAEVGQRTAASIRRRLYDHIQRSSRSFHDTQKSGDLLVRLTGDINLLKEMLVNFIVTATGGVLVLTGMIVIMFIMDWQLTLMALVTVPILMISIGKYTRGIKEATNRARRNEGRVASLAHESLNFISLVHAFSLENLQYDKFSRFNRSNLRAGLKSTRLAASFQRIIELVLAGGSCVVLWFGVRRVMDGVLTPGDLLVFVSYMKDMYRPLRKLSKLTSRVAKATACGERVLEILDIEPEIKDSPGAIAAAPFRGEIAFDNVSFSYGDSDCVLRDINFAIEPGQTVALVGPSGTGKTTLVNLVLRFYDPAQGAVRIDGYDLREITLESLRNQISVIMHEPSMFGLSIRENIALGKPEATEEEIIQATKIANAHDFIMNMEDGYDTIVGEQGSTLSRGQKQRISLARAAVRDAPIIILDEPTTGLDVESEFLVVDSLTRMTEKRTCIVIAHHFSTISSADRILVLEGTSIIEDGSHDQLMKTGSRYHELYSMQLASGGEGGSGEEGR